MSNHDSEGNHGASSGSPPPVGAMIPQPLRASSTSSGYEISLPENTVSTLGNFDIKNTLYYVGDTDVGSSDLSVGNPKLPPGSNHELICGTSFNDVTVAGKHHICLRCLESTYTNSHSYSYQRRTCIFDCPIVSNSPAQNWDHFRAEHVWENGSYPCRVPNCARRFKRMPDLMRHYSIYCTRADKFPCDVIGCKFGGDNGFPRKDKLRDHKRKVHEGKAAPDQLMRRRPLAPKPQGGLSASQLPVGESSRQG